MSLVKISVENIDTSDRILHEIDKSLSLEENIKNVCKTFGKPVQTTVYGLKLITTNDGKPIHSYISESNFNEIKDGYFLKLVYSLSHYVQRIFDHIDDEFKERSFIDLYSLSIDPEFIKELVKAQKHVVLIDHYINKNLKDQELTACLIAIVHLFQRGYINEISEEFLQKTVKVLKNATHSEQIKYALSVIHKILYHKDPSFSQWKQEIITQIPIRELTPYIVKYDCRELQYGALLLINTIIKCCKGEKRLQLIKEINSKQNRENIFKHIISHGEVTKHMAHELYVYQTYLLSLYQEALNCSFSVYDSILQYEDFEPEDNRNPPSLLAEFEDDSLKSKTVSVENLLDNNNSVRISLASLASKQSDDTILSHRAESLSASGEYENSKISMLTIEVLRHYQRYHEKNFLQSQTEEQFYNPGILITSEKIVQILAQLLDIGMEPARNCFLYQPTVFNCNSNATFLPELFSRTMWLVSKTRREMKAVTIDDYPKMIYIIHKKLKIVLDEKPIDFKAITQLMVTTTYDTVIKRWQKQKNEEFEDTLEHNPTIQPLRAAFTAQNEEVVFQQRINQMQKGQVFPKILEKKMSGKFMAKLSENQRQIITWDYNNATQEYSPEPEIFNIDDITHIVEGNACPHIRIGITKNAELAFSIIVEHSMYVNFQAPDKRTASYWVDGLNLLLGKEKRSKYYTDELNELVKMDLNLHLLDLQLVSIPKRPPPIPPPPFETRPPLPPKPLVFQR